MKKLIPIIIVLLAVIIPPAYLWYTFPLLPSTVPIHFGIDGTPDRMGSKNELVGVVCLFAALSAGVYLLLSNVYRIDPKKYAAVNKHRMKIIGVAVAVFMAFVNIGIIRSTVTANANGLTHFIFPTIGVLFAVIGNYMSNLKPNYFMGLRLPWTLDSEYNWRLTHQYAAKWWFWGGVAIAVTTAFLPAIPQMIAFFAITLVVVIVPAVFSYRLYRQQKAQP